MQVQNQARREESWDAQENVEPPGLLAFPTIFGLAHDIAFAGVYVAKGTHDAALGRTPKLELDFEKSNTFMQCSRADTSERVVLKGKKLR
jgi:hypothetical protein